VQYGPVGTSAGQIKGSVTVPYTFQGAGSPLPRVAAAKKAALVQTDEGSLWAKQPVLLKNARGARRRSAGYFRRLHACLNKGM